MDWRFDVTKELEWPPLEQPLVDTLHWRAAFESYDRDAHRCRYRLELFEGERSLATTAAEVTLSRGPVSSGEDPELVRELRTRLDRFAVRTAIATCERWDWLIRLAYSATSDHQEALYRAMLYGEHDRQLQLRGAFWPVVTPRELVWAKLGHADAEDEWQRARLGGLFLGMGPALATYYLVFHPSEYERPIAAALIFGFAFVARRLILWLRARTFRERAAAIDDAEALRIALADLPAAMARDASRPERLRQFGLKALREHLLGSFPETPTAEDIQLDRIGAQLER